MTENRTNPLLNLERKAKEALQWILEIMKKRNVKFQISGGLAAKFYGSPRPLNDIDIDIVKKDFDKIFEDVREYIVYGPGQYCDEKWDLYLMTLNYHGQEIDVGSFEAKIFDPILNRWVESNIDISSAQIFEMDGMKVPVMAKDKLIAYKRLLNGDHQKLDIESILRNSFD